MSRNNRKLLGIKEKQENKEIDEGDVAPDENGWVKWRSCVSREILMADLEPGGILDGSNHLEAEEVWEFYKTVPVFMSEEIVFSQFKARLKDHRTQAKHSKEMAERDEKAVAHDRTIHPRQLIDSNGKVMFDLHPAKLQLREDVKNGLHNQMTPSQLQNSRMEVFGVFEPEKFRHRIYQEVRRTKWIHYLELKQVKIGRSAPRSHKFGSTSSSH